jgi:hypothetical protein
MLSGTFACVEVVVGVGGGVAAQTQDGLFLGGRLEIDTQ